MWRTRCLLTVHARYCYPSVAYGSPWRSLFTVLAGYRRRPQWGFPRTIRQSSYLCDPYDPSAARPTLPLNRATASIQFILCIALLWILTVPLRPISQTAYQEALHSPEHQSRPCTAATGAPAPTATHSATSPGGRRPPLQSDPAAAAAGRPQEMATSGPTAVCRRWSDGPRRWGGNGERLSAGAARTGELSDRWPTPGIQWER